MKKVLVITIAIVLAVGFAACGAQATKEAAPTPTEKVSTEPTGAQAEATTPDPEPEQADWEYDEATKTLYVNVDMGAFEPDAPDFDGTTSNAPWAEYLPEIENIVVGDDVTFIGDYAFAFCPNLKSVEVGQNVGALDFRCFFKCGDFDNDSGIDMYFNSTPEYGDDVFGYTWDNPNVVIYVPDDMKEHWVVFIMQKGEMRLDGYDMQPQMPQNKDEVLFSMLENPQELWSEGSAGFAENQGGEFGGGAAEKRYNEHEGRLEMFSDDNGACVPFNTTLRDCGQDDRQQQAVMVRFQPENVPDFRFSFEGLDEVAISFREDGPYITDVAQFYKMPFSDYAPHTFEVKGSSIYNILFAVDENAIMRVFVWEEGVIENQAYLEYDLYHGDNGIYDCHWNMFIGFGANGQFNIYEYWVYTFDSFMDNPPVVVQGE